MDSDPASVPRDGEGSLKDQKGIIVCFCSEQSTRTGGTGMAFHG